ncbi:MATE family efflux transporter [Elusimicrobiota bacterium]
MLKIFTLSNLKKRWHSEGGYKEFINIAFPLILSTGMWSVQHFVDRMFLTWYSPESIAASMPAGMLNFSIVSIFLGTVSYTGTFVAQYFGAKQFRKIGPSIWQGIYLSFIGGIFILAFVPFSKSIFTFIGHESAVMQNEIIYFRILCMGAFPVLATAAMSGFYSGRGKTWPVMWVAAAGTAVNLILDYFLIFGNWIFPEMGIKGAAIATVCSAIATFLIYFILVSKPSFNTQFATLKGWRLNTNLFRRVVFFGFPSGVQFFLDMAGFTVFILIIGSLGTVSLAASNIAFNINTLAFMPMIGGGIALSVLVGQYLGKNRPETAEKSAYSAFHLTFGYMAAVSILYVVIPSVFIAPFAAKANPENFAQIRDLAIVLLRFVAAYSLFDTMNIVFANAIKGAGDTHYIMRTLALVSLIVLIIPTYIAIIVLKGGIYTGWAIGSLYVAILGFIFLFRFRKGKWKSMRVIEVSEPTIPSNFPEVPSGQI